MTKSTITRERIQRIIRAINSEAYDEEEIREWLSSDEIMELSRMALAAMDSEPVAWRRFQETPNDGGYWILYDYRPNCSGVEPLYRHAQPAPVVEREPIAWLNDAYLARGVVDGEAGSEDAGPGYIPVYREAGPQPAPVVPVGLEHLRSIVADPRLLPRRKEWIGGQQYSYVLLEEVEAMVDEACRAAMLQAEPVTTANKLGNSPVTPDGSAVTALNGIPMIPDGYVMVPKEPTDEMLAAAKEWTGLTSTAEVVYIKMLAAAPQSPDSEPATVPGTWIPVSEKMPPSRHEVLVGRWWGEKSRWCCKRATYIPGHPDAQSSGWLIPGASWTPTHWMPLPTAPQEPKP